MSTYIAVSVIAVIIGTIYLPEQIRLRRMKEITVFLLYLLSGSAMSIIAIDLESVPSPLEFIVWIYKPVNQMLGGLF
ncbi:hypothetical protein [Paenibacillus sp. SYP-B4298]|uniref:hypothetical protein n=1 Tax=Paenibacillus sp. SYP-B4298 TaxID=2996034 RepID=UPI0022DD6CE3|nr:hypothetical protein [Paenibacillus sp. SYP-B4298]